MSNAASSEAETAKGEKVKQEAVTVFAIRNCPFCTRAKNLLSAKGIPYTEINISFYPSKRTDMLSLSDSLTVPQVFFGNQYIGGSDALDSWFTTHDVDEIKSYGHPTDERLLFPTYPPVEEKKLPPRNVDQFQVLTKLVTQERENINPYVQIAHALERTLPLSTIDGYKKVITKSDLERYLSSVLDSRDAQRAMEELLQYEVIVPVLPSSESEKTLYRLYQHSQPLILNSFRKWRDTRNVDPITLVHQLKSMMDKVQSKYADSNGLVDYISMSADVEFAAFDEASCELQHVSLRDMDERTRLAFVIMLYNIMIKHAFTKIGTPGVPVGPFFENVKYDVGGMIFSFSELENGILRGNRIPPGHEKPFFDANDERRSVALSKVDPRIHFSLNCGAKSCPPIKKYTADAIEEELRIVAIAFCESDENVRIDAENDTLYLNQIFNWYGVDFGSNLSDVAATVNSYLWGEKRKQMQRVLNDEQRRQNLKLEFVKYDWSTDSQTLMPFILEDAKLDP